MNESHVTLIPFCALRLIFEPGIGTGSVRAEKNQSKGDPRELPALQTWQPVFRIDVLALH